MAETQGARRGEARHTLRIRRVISIKCCRSRDNDGNGNGDVAKVANMKSNMRYGRRRRRPSERLGEAAGGHVDDDDDGDGDCDVARTHVPVQTDEEEEEEEEQEQAQAEMETECE